MWRCPPQFRRQTERRGSAADRFANAEIEFGVGPERLTPLVHAAKPMVAWTEQLALRFCVKSREAVGTTAIGRKRE